MVIGKALEAAQEREQHIASMSTRIVHNEGPLRGDISTNLVNIAPQGKYHPMFATNGRITHLFLQQVYGEDCRSLHATAAYFFLQSLAEDDMHWKATKSKSNVEMFLLKFHKFLGVFDKGKMEHLPEHKPYNLGIDLGSDTMPPAQ